MYQSVWESIEVTINIHYLSVVCTEVWFAAGVPEKMKDHYILSY